MKSYGYARVSSRDQNLNRQLDALQAFPLSPESIYVDKCTGATFDRPRYQALVRKMQAGDVLVIKSIDRLGRNYAEILDQWHSLTRDLGVDVVVLDMPLLDTRGTSAEGRDLTGQFISDVVLQLLSYIAQVERENIHQRQAEGIAAAKARGAKFGRPRKQPPADWEGIRDRIACGELTQVEAARQLGVCRNTLRRWLKEDQTAEPSCASR